MRCRTPPQVDATNGTGGGALLVAVADETDLGLSGAAAPSAGGEVLLHP
jgi:hypothetical protein